MRFDAQASDLLSEDEIRPRIVPAVQWLAGRVVRRFTRRLTAINALDLAGYFITLLALALAVGAISAREEPRSQSVWVVPLDLPGASGPAAVIALLIVGTGAIGAALSYAGGRLAVDLSRDVQLDLADDVITRLERPGSLGTLADLDDNPRRLIAQLLLSNTRSVGLLCTRGAMLVVPFVSIVSGATLMLLASPQIVIVFLPLFAGYMAAVTGVGRWAAQQQRVHHEANNTLSRRMRHAAEAFTGGDLQALRDVTDEQAFGESLLVFQLRFFATEKVEAASAVFVVCGYGLLLLAEDWFTLADLSIAMILAFAVGFRHFSSGVRKLGGLVTTVGRHGVDLANLVAMILRLDRLEAERGARPSWIEVSTEGVELRFEGPSSGDASPELRSDAVIWFISHRPQKVASLQSVPRLVETCLEPRPDLYRGLAVPSGAETPAALARDGGVIVVGRGDLDEAVVAWAGLTIVVTRRPESALRAKRCDAVIVEAGNQVVGAGGRNWLENTLDIVRAALESHDHNESSHLAVDDIIDDV